MQKITPFFWFDGKIREAVTFYTTIFTEMVVLSVSENDATLQLEGQTLILFNGGSYFKLSPAVSLFVNCHDQAEIDRLYEQLTAEGGQGSQCGWLTDKFGLSWQLVPSNLRAMLQDPNPEKAAGVRQAMLQMGKLEISVLEKAYVG